MIELHILLATGYFLVVAIAVVIEHHYLRHLPELVRRGIGGVTVLAPAFLLALFGVIDLWTWLIIAAGFVAAGGTLAALVIVEANHEIDDRIRKIVDHVIN